MSLLTSAFWLLFRMSEINFSEIPMLFVNGNRRHIQRPPQQQRAAFTDVRNTVNTIAGIANAWIKAAKCCILPWPGETFDRSAFRKDRRRDFRADADDLKNAFDQIWRQMAKTVWRRRDSCGLDPVEFCEKFSF